MAPYRIDDLPMDIFRVGGYFQHSVVTGNLPDSPLPTPSDDSDWSVGSLQVPTHGITGDDAILGHFSGAWVLLLLSLRDYIVFHQPTEPAIHTNYSILLYPVREMQPGLPNDHRYRQTSENQTTGDRYALCGMRSLR